MRLGILSDTHDELARTKCAIDLLRREGASAIAHCGDLASPPILAACSVMPCWFCFGNHDSDSVPVLQQAAKELGAICLGWGGVFVLEGKKMGLCHGHMTTDLRSVLAQRPDYLLSGHAHYPSDVVVDSTRRINPGALHRADEYTVAILEISTGELHWLRIAE
ncbi:MAG: metallophosphatase family protein [Gemmataceae bacterium]|nr:metallophosphatase family protein [Gemmataceae bacterium]